MKVTSYDELLSAMATDAAVVDELREAGARRSWWSADRHWRRTYERFDPENPIVVTLLFETVDPPQQICRVELFESEPATENAQEMHPMRTHLGRLRLTRFPYDRRLPSLPAVLDSAPPATVVRYRPHKRCTIRFEHRGNGQPTFAKVFSDDRGRRIHCESIVVWQASDSGLLDFRVARPIRWDAGTRTVWQEAVEGESVVGKLATSQGPSLAERMGRAAASLSRSPLVPEQVLDAAQQLRRTRRYAEELRQRLPCLRSVIDRFIEQLAALHDAAPSRPLRPIHGSPHAHQWLDDGHRLGLVDFDRLSLGHPELDVATFLAEMDFEDRHTVPVDEIDRAFLDGFESVAGPLDPLLLRAYRAHKVLSKALKAARAVRPDGAMRAERNLRRAMAHVCGEAS